MTPDFEPEWKPLVEHIPAELCGDFMFMASYPTSEGRTVYAYKHRDSRRYLNIDEKGVFYRYEGGGYAQLTEQEAEAVREQFQPTGV